MAQHKPISPPEDPVNTTSFQLHPPMVLPDDLGNEDWRKDPRWKSLVNTPSRSTPLPPDTLVPDKSPARSFSDPDPDSLSADEKLLPPSSTKSFVHLRRDKEYVKRPPVYLPGLDDRLSGGPELPDTADSGSDSDECSPRTRPKTVKVWEPMRKLTPLKLPGPSYDDRLIQQMVENHRNEDPLIVNVHVDLPMSLARNMDDTIPHMMFFQHALERYRNQRDESPEQRSISAEDLEERRRYFSTGFRDVRKQIYDLRHPEENHILPSSLVRYISTVTLENPFDNDDVQNRHGDQYVVLVVYNDSWALCVKVNLTVPLEMKGGTIGRVASRLSSSDTVKLKFDPQILHLLPLCALTLESNYAKYRKIVRRSTRIYSLPFLAVKEPWQGGLVRVEARGRSQAEFNRFCKEGYITMDENLYGRYREVFRLIRLERDLRDDPIHLPVVPKGWTPPEGHDLSGSAPPVSPPKHQDNPTGTTEDTKRSSNPFKSLGKSFGRRKRGMPKRGTVESDVVEKAGDPDEGAAMPATRDPEALSASLQEEKPLLDHNPGPKEKHAIPKGPIATTVGGFRKGLRAVSKRLNEGSPSSVPAADAAQPLSGQENRRIVRDIDDSSVAAMRRYDLALMRRRKAAAGRASPGPSSATPANSSEPDKVGPPSASGARVHSLSTTPPTGSGQQTAVGSRVPSLGSALPNPTGGSQDLLILPVPGPSRLQSSATAVEDPSAPSTNPDAGRVKSARSGPPKDEDEEFPRRPPKKKKTGFKKFWPKIIGPATGTTAGRMGVAPTALGI